MKTIGIFYFSGTGNTELVAEIIKRKFVELDCTVDLIRMEDIRKAGLYLEPDQYDYLGIGCPVIGFGVPRLAAEFVRDLPASDGKKTFLFRTAGGVAPVNYNASKPIMRSLAKKGYEVYYERVFSISSNWVEKFDDDIVKQLYEATKRKAEKMCLEILRGEQHILRTGVRLRLLMGMVRSISSGVLCFMGKDLFAGRSCTHCGFCIKHCPASNISEKEGKIHFGNSCSSCMRCVYSCPSHAIRFRFLTFFPVKGGYNITETLNKPVYSDTAKTLHHEHGNSKGKIPPFFFEYIQNDDL